MLPLVLSAARPGPLSLLELAVVSLGVIPAAWFLVEGQRLAGQPLRRIAVEVPSAFALGIGLSLNNARAVLGGLGSRLGRWERTPKAGSRDAPHGPPRYREAPWHAGSAELALAAYFAVTAAVAWSGPFHGEAPNAVLIGAGFGWAAWSSWRAARARGDRCGPLEPDDLRGLPPLQGIARVDHQLRVTQHARERDVAVGGGDDHAIEALEVLGLELDAR